MDSEFSGSTSRVGSYQFIEEIITDALDPRVDHFRDLSAADRRPDLTNPDGENAPGLVIAEGTVVIERMLNSPFVPHALLGTAKRLQQLSELSAAQPQSSAPVISIPYYTASAEIMATVVGFHLNRGVLAVARRPQPRTLKSIASQASSIAILDGVNDHENIGSLFRNASALGIDAVLLGPTTADPLYRRAVRVSMGHVLRIPFAIAENWPEDLNLLRKQGFTTIAMTPSASKNLADCNLDGKVALIFGAEGPGLSEEVMAAAAYRAKIPMFNNADSLNVATAAAVAFYERVRSIGIG